MTTQTAPAVSAGGTPPATPPSSSGSGSSWLASWRVALRLARRDVRRHRGRSLAVLIMVGVPTMLICVGLVLGATSQVSPQESIPLTLGTAQAHVEVNPGGGRVTQLADPSRGYSTTDTPAREIPGFRAGSGAELNAAAISDLTGAEVVASSEGRIRVRIGDRDLGLETLALPGPERFTGKVTLRSGQWPDRSDEVLVSPAAARRGIPESGPLQIVGEGGERTVTVVGTAIATTQWGAPHDLVTTDSDLLAAEGARSVWYVMGDRPVTWDRVRELNEYGLLVSSAQVLAQPPAQDDLAPEWRDTGEVSSDQAALIALGATLLLIVIALLVGPAFAVGATRQRRTLALAASNGATAAQLRRTVLAQAIVLGGLSALAGVAASVPVTWVIAREVTDRGSAMGPFDVPWWQLGAIWSIAVVAAILAALVPAQRLTRLDIVGAMRGRVVTPPPSRWLFVVGLILAGLGGAGVIVGLDRSEYVIAVAAVLLVLGTLLLVPRILHTLGRFAGPLPLPLRLAVRDLARHRTRSAPTVAAVLAGTAALTMGLVGASSDDAQEREDYVPQTLHGEAYVYSGGPSDAADPFARVERELPDLVVVPVQSYRADTEVLPSGSGEVPDEPFATTLPRGCTVDDLLGTDESGGGDVDAAPGTGTGNRCFDLASGSGVLPTTSTISFMPAAEIVRRFALTGGEARTVTDGGGLLVSNDADDVVSDGRVEVARGTLSTDLDSGRYSLVGSATSSRIPAVTRPRTRDNLARSVHAGLVLPSEIAEREGWPVMPDMQLVHDPDGPIDARTQERLQQLLGDDTYVEVERGWQNPLAIVIAVLIGIFTLVLLVVTLTATALSMAEQERDQATIAAVGGSGRTRRLMVASQTWLLATTGIVLGALVGLFPGITIARALTSEGWDPVTNMQVARDATVDVPWTALLVVLVAVPALAALLAGLGIRRTPDLTRRTE
ncbi:FtsX-like permease family protein [Janibacter anophelis]|uniref:FtsX-like permease family protein n=1 Tax=Janibacter anophelis TaxID=319054 RepID=UPI000A01471F|nr:FtsX-like permease family protein [Janibacter anophelis]